MSEQFTRDVFGIQPVVKHRIFVSYHHRGDQAYYDAFSKHFHDQYETVYDNSLERRIESNDADYVMRTIRENFITGTSCTVVLVGAETWGRKYVDWEIKATLDKQHALVGIQLPTAIGGIIPERLFDNIQSGYALWLSWQQIIGQPAQLLHVIKEAKTRSLGLAFNTRPLLTRNQ